MTEPDRNGIASRLWSLPGQLLLALINATSIMVIVAAILALVAIDRIDHFAENVVATMTEAVVPVGNSILLATDVESGDAPALCQRFVA